MIMEQSIKILVDNHSKIDKNNFIMTDCISRNQPETFLHKSTDKKNQKDMGNTNDEDKNLCIIYL